MITVFIGVLSSSSFFPVRTSLNEWPWTSPCIPCVRRIQRKKALLAWFTFIPNDISAGPGAFGNEKRVGGAICQRRQMMSPQLGSESSFPCAPSKYPSRRAHSPSSLPNAPVNQPGNHPRCHTFPRWDGHTGHTRNHYRDCIIQYHRPCK